MVMAQLKWPATTYESRPWTRWWWEGSAVNKGDISRLMKMYSDAGLGGVEITPIYGVHGEESKFISYLSPQWTEMLQHTLAEGSKFKMGVDMATGTGWPFGGPWITYQDACKQVVYKSWKLKKGERVKDRISLMQEPLFRSAANKGAALSDVKDPVESNNNLQELAIDQVKFAKPMPVVAVMAYANGQAPMNLMEKITPDSVLNWTSPFDDCEVYALFQGWHGKMVERAAPGGEGNVIDHFSRKAIDTYFKKFDDAFAGKDISTLRSFFNDSYEVDDARGQSNWTPEFFNEFTQRRGYDLRNYLPALFGKSDNETNARVLYDYRETISEMLLDNFTIPWAAWAKKHGALVRNQSHGSPGNTMDLYAAVDIPETEGTELLRFKFATSAAHVTGKKLASAESATWLGEHFKSTLGDVKQALDKYFIGGVNHVVYHGTSYSPQDAPWPGWLFYAAVHFQPNNPFWQQFPALNKYVERCQSFLQAGSADNDVLVYYPYADAQMERGRDLLKHYDAMKPEFLNTPFEEVSEWMLGNGVAFDFISDKQLLNVKNAGSKLATGGVQYQAILLPANKFIPLSTLRHLLELVENGAQLLVYKSLPADVPGLAHHEEDAEALKALMQTLQFTTAGGAQVAIFGKGKVWLGADAKTLVEASGTRKETIASTGLQFIRRKYQKGHVYFVSNPGTKTIDTTMMLQVNDKFAALFDPMTGRMGTIKAVPGKSGGLAIRLQLGAGQSVIAQTSPSSLGNVTFALYASAGAAQQLTGNWQVKFEDGGAVLPPAKTVSTLSSWTTWGGPEYQFFSGTASYTTSFKKPAGVAVAYTIDLGKVAESADVWLNGKKIGTVLGPDYSVIVPASALVASNTLVVKVSNSMANRIIQLEKQGVIWKRFYNTNFPARLPENRGSDGLFTPIKWEPFESGLLGPVALVPLKMVK